MPGFNGTGPDGQGKLTGRGLGYCNTTTDTKADVKTTGPIAEDQQLPPYAYARNSGMGRGLGLGAGLARPAYGRGMAFRRGGGRGFRRGGGRGGRW